MPTDAAQVLTELTEAEKEHVRMIREECYDADGRPIKGTLYARMLLAIIDRLSASRPPTEGPEGRYRETLESIAGDGCSWSSGDCSTHTVPACAACIARAALDPAFAPRLIPPPPEQPEEEQ